MGIQARRPVSLAAGDFGASWPCDLVFSEQTVKHPMMYRKKLIEVALPLEAINKASALEKSIRHGHPSTLHLWWARRPLAAARAVIFAQMSARRVHYMRHPFYRDPDCGMTNVSYDFCALLTRDEASA